MDMIGSSWICDSTVRDPEVSQLTSVSATDPLHRNVDLKLTDQQIENLSQVIVSKHMATIAIKYLEIPQVTVENLKLIRQNDYVAFNRDLLVLWRNKNSGINHVQVSEIFLCFSFVICGMHKTETWCYSLSWLSVCIPNKMIPYHHYYSVQKFAIKLT